MAALTATASRTQVPGADHEVIAQLPAVSDGDTFVTGLRSIVPGSVLITFADASAVAADSIAVDSVSGGTITFQVAGTARAANVRCLGVR